MHAKRTFYLAAALAIVVVAILVVCLSTRWGGYPLSITFVEWTDTWAPPAEIASQAGFPTQKGDWARLAVTNNGTKPLRFDSREVEYELDGRWLPVSTNGWSGVHGAIWWPGTGSLLSVPRPPQVPTTAHWRFHFVCALDPVKGPRRSLNQMATNLFGGNSLLFCAPTAMLSSEIPPREPNQQGGANGRQTSSSDTNRRPAAAIRVAGLPQAIDFSTGAINFINMKFSDILPFYASLTEAEMDTSQLKNLPPVLMSFENKKTLTLAEAVQLLDKVFYDHGIVATHVDKKHVTFTYRAAERKK